MSGYVRGAGSAGQPSCPPELAQALELAKPLHEPARCGRVGLTAAARLAMSALLRVRVWGPGAGQGEGVGSGCGPGCGCGVRVRARCGAGLARGVGWQEGRISRPARRVERGRGAGVA